MRSNSPEHSDSYMFCRCPDLQRLSIKDCVLCIRQTNKSYAPLYQALLIKMVRYHPSIRWLRSDLTDESVAMLKRERPDITFVSK